MAIPYRIKQIKTKQFAYFPDNYINGKDVSINVGFGFNVQSDLKKIICVSRFSYNQDDVLLMTTEIECSFEISQDGFEQLQQTRTVPVAFLRYLATIATGTARGIIHAQTEGTVINSIVLPPINLTEVITTDLTF